jgi:hypothetical protein
MMIGTNFIHRKNQTCRTDLSERGAYVQHGWLDINEQNHMVMNC